MRISYNWLKEYIDINLSPEQLAERFTMAGLEVDEIVYRGDDLQNVVVAEIKSAERVENSDHLTLCRVYDGSELLQIVCGAPNVTVGRKVALAKIGAKLPGGVKIKKAKLAGIESFGMLCSSAELGIDPEGTAGIWLLNDDLPLGIELSDALGLKDAVIVVELTPNRNDCLGMINVAHEAAALSDVRVKLPRPQYRESGGEVAQQAAIDVENSSLCPRYIGRLVKNITVGKSPAWMQQYLLASGMRPINGVVDISNFVMLETGQPLHFFDYDKLAGHKIIVRQALSGETMQTLDGKQRQLLGEEILICDGEKPVCIAGVMGGSDTEVTESTKSVLIESACFAQVPIRRASRRLGIPSEASLRFEKGVDIEGCEFASRRAVQLLCEFCGGEAARGSIDVRIAPTPTKKVKLRQKKVNQVLGTSFTQTEITEVICALGFPIEMVSDCLQVEVPTYRQDITFEIDLIEEIARIKGYDNIPITIPASAAQGRRTPQQQLIRKINQLIRTHGLIETINYSFISNKEAERLQLPTNHAWHKGLAILNPINEEQSVMRQSLLPGLLHCLTRNLNRRNDNCAIYELGKVFIPQAKADQPDEVMTLCCVLCGQAPSYWKNGGEEYDYFYLKGIIEDLLTAVGVNNAAFVRAKYSFLHPGRSAAVLVGGQEIGYIGELHPQVVANYQADGAVIAAELDLRPLLALAELLPKGEELPRYPAVNRDIALIGDNSIAAAEIEQEILRLGGKDLQEARLFDLYEGAPIEAGQRSLAYSLLFQSKQRTLTDSEIDAAFARIVAGVADKWGLKLR